MPYIASMGIYVISKDVMIELLRDKFPEANDFGSEVIPGATSIGMRVCCLSHSYHISLLNAMYVICSSTLIGPSLLIRWVLGGYWYD